MIEESIARGDVGDRLHQFDGLAEQRRFVGQRNAGVDVEHVGPGLDLGYGVGLDPAEVSVLHLFGQQLAACGVDAFADHHEGPIKPDYHFFGGGTDDGFSHGAESPSRSEVQGHRW